MDERLPGRATICGVFWQQAAPTNWINRRRTRRVSLNYTARHDPRFLSFLFIWNGKWKKKEKKRKEREVKPIGGEEARERSITRI